MPHANDGSQPAVDTTNQVSDNNSSTVKLIYAVFDLETTGFSRLNDDIVEISAQALDQDGDNLPCAPWTRLVKPPNGVGDSESIHGYFSTTWMLAF